MQVADEIQTFFPYPAHPARRAGYIIADIVLLGLAVMFVVMLFPTLIR